MQTNEMTTPQAIEKMMCMWNTIMNLTKKEFPKANEEKLYKICQSAMNRALGIK